MSLDESEHWAEITKKGLEVSGYDLSNIKINICKRLENEYGSFYDYKYD